VAYAFAYPEPTRLKRKADVQSPNISRSQISEARRTALVGRAGPRSREQVLSLDLIFQVGRIERRAGALYRAAVSWHAGGPEGFRAK
jgi:hypothetical protein